MFLLDWFLASIRRISKKPLLFTASIYSQKVAKAFRYEDDKCKYSCLPKMSCCPVIAPGLPRQRLDGLEIIVRCECEEEEYDEEENINENGETSNDDVCHSKRRSVNLANLKRSSTPHPALSESGCQTSRCDLSSYRECENVKTSDSDVMCTTADVACSSTSLNNAVQPNINAAIAQAITRQAWLRYSKKAASIADAGDECSRIQAVDEMWNKMTSIQKFPYFWDAIEHDPISANPFDNFLNYYKSQRKVSSPRAANRIMKTWRRMSYKDRLPFIVESFIYKMKNHERCHNECYIRKFFTGHRRQAKKKSTC